MRSVLSKYLKRVLILITIGILPTLPIAGASKTWEPVKTERSDAKSIIRDTDIEIKAASGVIIISCNHPTQIKIFTILGRLVNNETLPPGRSQLQLPTHGVYLVKIGDLTCKVAV